MPNDKSNSISNGTIGRIVLWILILAFIFIIRDVLALFFVAIILAAAFDPWIDWLDNKKIPRSLSIICVYVLFIFIVGGVIYLLTGPIIEQIKDIARAFPSFYYSINHVLQNFQNAGGLTNPAIGSFSLGEVTRWLTSATSGIFGFVSSLFGGIVGFFSVLVMTFYLTAEEDRLKKFICQLAAPSRRSQVGKLVDGIQQRIGYWFRGQIVLSLAIFIAVYIGLSILHVKYALLLAILAGILEIIPFLGPWIAAILGVFFAFMDSPMKALWVALLYFAIQQLENQLLVPKVMGKSTGLNPIIVILAVLAGARLGGIIGALLAIPITSALSVYMDMFLLNRNDNSAE
ncbi:MAG: AI-2E family transporter [Patescibacteria group bacterium]